MSLRRIPHADRGVDGAIVQAGDIARPGVERTVALAVLGLLAALCCAYLLLRLGRLAPSDGAATATAAPLPYHGADLARMFALWVVVIAATMLPAAAPSVLLYARVRRARGDGAVVAGAGAFLAGQLCAWSACALVATVVDWLLHDAGALDETLAVAHPSALALVLVGAGVYQWTPAKHWYLDNCREPLAIILTHWRRGARGALRMGAADARYGLGCCWLLLAVVVPAGVFNLPVIGALVALILAEKLLPGGHTLACATGLGLVALGTILLFP